MNNYKIENLFFDILESQLQTLMSTKGKEKATKISSFEDNVSDEDYCDESDFVGHIDPGSYEDDYGYGDYCEYVSPDPYEGNHYDDLEYEGCMTLEPQELKTDNSDDDEIPELIPYYGDDDNKEIHDLLKNPENFKIINIIKNDAKYVPSGIEKVKKEKNTDKPEKINHLSLQEVKDRIEKMHPGKYDMSKMTYNKQKERIEGLRCIKHNRVITANSRRLALLDTYLPCPDCVSKMEEYITKAKEIRNDTDYTDTLFDNVDDPTTKMKCITCDIVYSQKFSSHLAKVQGCPNCVKKNPGRTDPARLFRNEYPDIYNKIDIKMTEEKTTTKPKGLMSTSKQYVWFGGCPNDPSHRFRDKPRVQRHGYECRVCKNYTLKNAYPDIFKLIDQDKTDEYYAKLSKTPETTKKRQIVNKVKADKVDKPKRKTKKSTPPDKINYDLLMPFCHILVIFGCTVDSSHFYSMQVANKTCGYACKHCSKKLVSSSNNLKQSYPTIAKQWHPDNDGKPKFHAKSSTYRAKWICANGHIWYATINSRTSHMSDCPYCVLSRKYSKKAVAWLKSLAEKYNIEIWHPENSRIEYKIEGIGHVDGYSEVIKSDGKVIKIVWEFMGCKFHGCTKCCKDRDDVHFYMKEDGTTYEQLYQKTLDRNQRIRAAGYKLVIVWEHEYDYFNKVNTPPPETPTKPLSPIKKPPPVNEDDDNVPEDD